MWSFFSRDPLRDFQYEISEVQDNLEGESVFVLKSGKSKVTGDKVSIFVFDIKFGTPAELEAARSYVKRLKTLRHPSILTFLDSCETETQIYLATEYVEPLQVHLSSLHEECKKNLYYPWGIMQVVRAIKFLNNDANLRHNNICSGAVFVNNAGEWKVGEVGYVSNMTDAYPCKILGTLLKYNPPELSGKTWQSNWTFDSWGLGVFIWEVFNNRMMKKSDLQCIEKIPKSLVKVYCELVGANPAKRPTAEEVLKRCSVQNGFFRNDLVEALLFLEEIQIKDKQQKIVFFNNLVPLIEKCPENLCKNKMLPQILNAFEFGEAGVSVLIPLLKVGSLMHGPDYQKLITPCIMKLYGSNDRATRCKLLQHIGEYIGEFTPSAVNEKLFPLIIHGFFDSNIIVRELTIKSIIHLAPKLSYNNLNVEVLKHFARIQSKDEEDGIRTNTTVCLGKVAEYLHPQVRQKVLISAFVRALYDPFPPSRVAGVLAFVACQQYFKLTDIAGQILPALSLLTVDPEITVRENVFRAMKGFLQKLEKVSENPELLEEVESEVNCTAAENSKVYSGGWAELAVLAMTLKLSGKSGKNNKAPSSDINITKEKTKEEPTGSLEYGDQDYEQDDATSQWEDKSPEIKTTAEGWDIDDWDMNDIENENVDKPDNQRKEEDTLKIPDKKPSERCKTRLSAPLKLGTKIS